MSKKSSYSNSLHEDLVKKSEEQVKKDLSNKVFEEYPKFVGDVIVKSKEEEEKLLGKKKTTKK